MNQPWLPLTDYSSKYKVSVSTLRRRIKAEDIQFRFQDGKYLIYDEPPTAGSQTPAHRPSLQMDDALLAGTPIGKPADRPFERTADRSAEFRAPDRTGTFGRNVHEEIQSRLEAKKDEPILLAANKLLNELKKAYTQILQEKEEQILQLKEEVADLKTLVRVLESENTRLRK